MIDPKVGEKTQFSKDRQPKKRRKPSQWKKYIKEYDITPIDREFMSKVVLTAKSIDDIKEMVKDGKLPFGIWAACVATLADAKKGGRGFLKYLNDAAFGKLPETIINKTEDNIDDDEIDEQIEALEEQIRKEMTAKIRKEERAKILKELEDEK